MADVTVKRIADMEAAFGGGFVRVRAELGVSSFGIQIINLPPSSGEMAPEHDHTIDGQEEVYMLLAGGGEVEVEGERHALEPGMMVRVGATERRRLRSGPEGMSVLAIGGVPGAVYQPHPITELGGPEVLPDHAQSSKF